MSAPDRAGSAAPATLPVARDPLPAGAVGPRLAAQLAFLLDAHRVVQVIRRNRTADGGRRESDGEHQWHAALMALVLAEHAAEPVDPLRVATMLLVHDLVEIDAGDVHLYDTAGRAAAAEREARAADRVFGQLPDDQGHGLRELWEEFESGGGADARFARAVDRLAPMLLNAASGGESWREAGVTADRVRALVLAPVAEGSPALAAAAAAVLDAAVAAGLLAPAAP